MATAELRLAAVVGDFHGHLVAFVDLFGTDSSLHGPTWQYVATDGGRSWRHTTAAGGV